MNRTTSILTVTAITTVLALSTNAYADDVIPDRIILINYNIPNLIGDSQILGYSGQDGWFTIDSFKFGVDRELKTSAEKKVLRTSILELVI